MAYLIDVKIEHLENLLKENKVTKDSLQERLDVMPWWKFRERDLYKNLISLNLGVNNGIVIAINVLKDKSITNQTHGEGSTISGRAPRYK